MLIIFLFFYLMYLIIGGYISAIISISLLLLLIIIYFIKNKIKSKIAYKKLNLTYDYARDIPNFLDVNDILFFKYNGFISKKHIKLMLMQLKIKGLINITKENNKLIIKKTNKDITTTKAEDYILSFIDGYEINSFSIRQYSKCIKEDLLKKQLANNKKDVPLFLFYLITSCTIFLIFAYIYVSKTLKSDINLDESIVYGFILMVLPNIPLYIIDKITENLNLKLTMKGYAYKYLIKAYKKFLKDFTLIDKLKNENYPLWEKHLLYAQALNVNLDYYKLPDIGIELLSQKEINDLLK